MFSTYEQLLFAEKWKTFTAMIIALDDAKNDCDENKSLAVTFWHRAIAYCPYNMSIVCSTEALKTRVQQFYVSLNSNSHQITYNCGALPDFYKVVLLMCENSSDFATKWNNHGNCDWAFNNLLFNSSDYGPVAEVLLSLLSYLCDLDEDAKASRLKQFIKNIHLAHSQSNFFRVLDIMLKTPFDFVALLDESAMAIILNRFSDGQATVESKTKFSHNRDNYLSTHVVPLLKVAHFIFSHVITYNPNFPEERIGRALQQANQSLADPYPEESLVQYREEMRNATIYAIEEFNRRKNNSIGFALSLLNTHMLPTVKSLAIDILNQILTFDIAASEVIVSNSVNCHASFKNAVDKSINAQDMGMYIYIFYFFFFYIY